MSENAKNPTAQNTIQDPPEYNTEKQGSDWLGGPQNGNETPSTSTEGAYSLGGWSGSIQEDWNSGHPGGAQNSNDNGIDRSIDSEDANRVKGIGPNEDPHVASGGIGGIDSSRVDPEDRSEDVHNAENATNPREGSDVSLGRGSGIGNKTPSQSAGGNAQGVDTQTGSQAKGMGFTGPLNFAVGGSQDV